MLLYGSGKDYNVVQIHHNNPLYDHILENIVHYCLKSHWTVGHTEEYYKGLRNIFIGMKSSLPFISKLNPNIIGPLIDI